MKVCILIACMSNIVTTVDSLNNGHLGILASVRYLGYVLYWGV